MPIFKFSSLPTLLLSLFLACNLHAQSSTVLDPTNANQNMPVNQQENSANLEQSQQIEQTDQDLDNTRANHLHSQDQNTLTNSAQSDNPQAPKLSHDLSVLGMYQGADIVVKFVMIGLVLASILTWTIALAKGFELVRAKSKLRGELTKLKQAHTLQQASQSTDHRGVLSHLLVFEAITEINLSAKNLVREGVKERVSFRLSHLIGNLGRNMSRGTGILATIGATAPFIGLFGTVWGIMNSFIGIAKSQTTNLAVVAPGIAEALLATALGLVAAIPAVIIYNVFARSITSYKAQINDCASEVLLLLSRDLDRDIKQVMQEISQEISHQH